MRLESAERVGSPSIPADLDAREAASPPSTLGGDDEASHPCRERLREKALPAATDPGRPPDPGRPSAPPASLQEPGGASAHHAVQLWSVDVGEARAASGPRFRTHGVAWQPSGCPIWEPSGSPTPRPERLTSLRPERHPALPPGTDEPSGCHGSLVGGEADSGQRAVTWQPSDCPIWEPSGSPTPRPGRLDPLRPERHPALPPGTDEPSGCHGSLVGGEADSGQRAVTWQPSGCPIWEPSGSPTPRPGRLDPLRPERHPALPPGTDEPSGCHGSLVGGEADPGPRALLLEAAAPAVADCLLVCPLDTRG
ncbi:hypothetical protein EMIHUDRAFT_232995 [Emiliania huxleyi CCMP1516]|uniref:Uncharacterized protein n=2 Tax=Emiliania huxleyi TaxID=2903 RepID=A0A0D3K3I5_EMIH1|nr:hypothetical protein EMIHUDRAFT_232995 [Emiliania huxleyi CCMP1516]EOD30320.1 hypothetical protein EMIHUDRAFT_232995 [Emiliania huxleyi CCMP1516]|eukprot:XP_005782749.1 hypothetical protein EMIHUDRAFT_232995 [Emiliania huxleyi CCMP1516]